MTLALCALSFVVGFIVRAILAIPTRELDSKGPLVKLGQGDFETHTHG
jgi:hypothetical protein